MPSTSSHRPDGLELVRRPAGAPPRAPRPRIASDPSAPEVLIRPRRVLLAAGEDVSPHGELVGHTAGIVEHLRHTAEIGVLTETASTAFPRLRPSGAAGSAPDPARTAPVAGGRPDLVLAVTPGLGGALAAGRLATRHHLPLVLVVHDLASARPGRRVRALRFAEAAERRLVHAADEILVLTPELGEVVTELGADPEHLHLLPHWAPRTPPGPSPDRIAARRALGWPLDAFTVVAPDTLGLRQDAATLARASSGVHPDVDVVLAGDGLRRALPCPTPGSVRRVGPLDGAGHRLAAIAADVLLLTEPADAAGPRVPAALAHCLTAGRPIVAAVPADGGVARELERTAGAGLLVPPGDPQTLAGALRSLSVDDDLRRSMGAAARRYVADRLDRGAALARLDAVLSSALAARAARA